MPRGTASAADQQLLAHADAASVRVTASQMARWRAHGLLPANARRALGRGKGSTSIPAGGADELVVFLGRQARAGRRPHDLALLAFDAGLAVPEPAALAATIRRVTLKMIFYGLSQAGRAIAAAAASVPAGSQDWQLRGHGVSQIGWGANLPDITVHATKTGSFVSLSKLLDSPTWREPDAVPLTALWNCIPDTRHLPLRDDLHRRTPLLVVPENDVRQHPMIISTVAYLPQTVVSSAHPAEDLATYMTAFPDADGYLPALTGDTPPRPNFNPHRDGWGELVMMWSAPGVPDGDAAERDRLLLTRTRQYDGQPYLMPAVGANMRGVHPLMSWWAVLHTLSMFARYEPSEWAGCIAVNSSPFAVPIEELLTTAINVVPRLISEAIDEVS
ncbi:YaaC family protein [Phytohabitans rumicis]|uniref:Uncharacterized protein n=1 Tax=Phytohabitans rumicis TaxID=1076125 RepID=A0A6V8LGB4_9ACTN|nr:hypothetical protein [Phytohabitans rumicis]GFJ93146.1 hypothetical protein Prum_067880 [Phytohabitans rumicis]